jgi:hypothetical protein
LKVSYISIFHEHFYRWRQTDPSTGRTAFSVVLTYSVTIDQTFSTGVPQKHKVPRNVTRGSAKGCGGNICIYINMVFSRSCLCVRCLVMIVKSIHFPKFGVTNYINIILAYYPFPPLKLFMFNQYLN